MVDADLVLLARLVDADPDLQAPGHEFHYKYPVVDHAFGSVFCLVGLLFSVVKH